MPAARHTSAGHALASVRFGALFVLISQQTHQATAHLHKCSSPQPLSSAAWGKAQHRPKGGGAGRPVHGALPGIEYQGAILEYETAAGNAEHPEHRHPLEGAPCRAAVSAVAGQEILVGQRNALAQAGTGFPAQAVQA